MLKVATRFNSVRLHITDSFNSLRDYKGCRHIIVFESDDWGSIRISSRKAWEELLRLGYSVDKRPYEKYDILESKKDLDDLFNILSSYRDCQGNHPVITGNMLMANPDFEKIKNSDYQHYYFRSIVQTYQDTYGSAEVIDVMKAGIESRVFMPQFHGREHFNVAHWLNLLQNKDEDTLTAFKLNICGIAPKNNPQAGNKLMVALRCRTEKEKKVATEGIREGLKFFKELWGFPSTSFVAPCYTWNDLIEKELANGGVELIQTTRRQRVDEKFISHYSGQRGNNGLFYSIRNCYFEPSITPNYDIDSTLKQISDAFNTKKIAVVSTHRVNYVSGIDSNNSSKTLLLLDELLKGVIKRWPDVVFMSSNQLSKLFKKQNE